MIQEFCEDLWTVSDYHLHWVTPHPVDPSRYNTFLLSDERCQLQVQRVALAFLPAKGRRKFTQNPILGKMRLPSHRGFGELYVLFHNYIAQNLSWSGWTKFILNQTVWNHLTLASRSLATFQTLCFFACFFNWLTVSFSSIHKTWSLPLPAIS